MKELTTKGIKDTTGKELKNLPEGWVWTTIAKVTLPIEKVSPKLQPDVPFVYIDISSIDNSIQKIVEPKEYLGLEAPSRAKQLVRVNDVVFSTVRTYLKNIALIPRIYDGQIASTGFSVLRTSNAVNAKFLFYYTLTDEFLSPLNELQRGTSYPAIRDGDVRIQPFPLPPLPEQERIVARIEELLSDLEAGVSALQRVRAGVKRYKASVLKAAVEGNLYVGAHGVRPSGQAGQAIGVGDLPEGWRWVKLDDIADIIGGVTKGRKLNGKTTITLPYLRVANVQRGRLDLDVMKEIEILTSEIEKYRLHDGDVVLTEGGDWDKLGRSAIWRNQIPNCIHQNHIFRARVKSSEVLSEWMMYYTNSEQGQNYFKEAAKQTTNLASINLTQLRACPLPLPLLEEQRRIVAEVEQRLEAVRAVEAAAEAGLKRAVRLRQALLRSAFEGRL